MTDREAIECFESDCKNCSVKDECKRLKEKGKLVCRNTNAISALQEREEQSKGCRYCLDANIEPELEGCDLSYHGVGCSEKGYRFLVRAGNRKPAAILFEKWNNDGWHTIGIYEPNNCPMCGRKLKTAMPEEEV